MKCECGCNQETKLHRGKANRFIKGHNKTGHKNWRGGTYKYWHSKAWILFGKTKCEFCGMSNDEHKRKWKTRLHIHCCGNPKDYTLMVADNWQTACKKHHHRLERLNKQEGVNLYDLLSISPENFF